MKNIFLASLITLSVSFSHSQEPSSNPNPINVTRQGFGSHNGINTNLGFVNANPITDGTAYYFDNWDTTGIIYTKNDGNVKIKQVNINLYDSTLEALYDDKSIFTFDSNNLMRIVINNKVFRTFEVNGDIKILEQFYKKGNAIYKLSKVIYSEASVNPQHARKRNRYIKTTKYYRYQNGELQKIKLSKRAFASTFKSDKNSEQDIADFLNKNKISLKEEADLKKVLQFLSR